MEAENGEGIIDHGKLKRGDYLIIDDLSRGFGSISDPARRAGRRRAS
jgi:hypothetical protein